MAGVIHQQRLILAAATLLNEPRMGPVGPNRQVPDFDWHTHVRNMRDYNFKLRYRVSWESFNTLLKILEPKLQVSNERQACNSRSGKPIQLQTRLAIALRYFAGGDVLDLILIYGVSRASVFSCIWCAVNAINSRLDNIHFPIDDIDRLREIEADFAAASRGGFWRGQVGAIDGVHFKMQAPSDADVPDAQRYHVHRKDMYALCSRLPSAMPIAASSGPTSA